MDIQVVCFSLYFISFVREIASRQLSDKFTVELGQIFASPQPWASYTVRNLRECAMFCAKAGGCQSANYKEPENQCEFLQTENASSLTPNAGGKAIANTVGKNDMQRITQNFV